jgi:hypothetical protein
VLTALPEPELVWGIFTRLVGVIYVVAFASMFGQITALVGDVGVMPVRLKLAAMRRDFPGIRRFLYFPSVLWISHGDRALRALVALGALSGVAVIYGGRASFPGILVGYVVFLSLDVALRLSFPWECVFFEMAAFGVFLPATLPLPALAATAAPAPAIAWAFRILLFRVVFGFGKFKFIGTTSQDTGYLKGFLINQPLPTVVAWFGQKLPLWALKLGLLSLFAVEIPGAALTLVPNWIGLVGGAGVAGLMVVINLSGNFGYFNWIVLALVVPLLDVHTASSLAITTFFDPRGPLFTNLFVGLHTLGALLYFPFNSYVSQSWPRWPLWLGVRPGFLAAPVALLRVIEPLRLLHSFGVFPPRSMAPVRNVAIIEISDDGETWHELEYRFAMTRPEHRPRFMAPYMARWDQTLIYESYGTTEYSLAYAVANSGMPYGHAAFSDAECLLERILEGHFYEGVLFAKNTFGRTTAPRFARMQTYVMVPTSLEEHAKTGKWWSRELIGPHYPAREQNPAFWQLWLPEPELFDVDDVVWRGRTPLSALLRRAAEGAPLAECVVAGAGDPDPVTPHDVDRFWSEFFPLARTAERGDWTHLEDVAIALRRRFSAVELRCFERVLRRLALALETRLGPSFSSRTPAPFPTHYEFSLFIDDLVADGPEALQAAFEDPESALGRVSSFTLERGLYLTALFRLERLVWEAHKIRLLDSILVRAGERFPTSARAAQERKMEASLSNVWGVSRLTPFLRARFRDSVFDGGTRETYPQFIELPTGEIRML